MRKNYYEDLTLGKTLSLESKKILIEQNWVNVAKSQGENPDATIRDMYLRQLNTNYVCKHLFPKDKLIDVGCGNGFATSQYADHVNYAFGIDYINDFVVLANKIHNKPNLRFEQGNVLNLKNVLDRFGQFNKVVCERTIINLVSWEDQQQALKQIDNLLSIGGFLFLTEVTLQGHQSMDQIRVQYGLDPLEKHWNNCYINEEWLLHYLGDSYDLVEKYNYGLYSMISKIIYPYSIYPQEPDFNAKINKIASELDEECQITNLPGHQITFIFKKTSDLVVMT